MKTIHIGLALVIACIAQTSIAAPRHVAVGAVLPLTGSAATIGGDILRGIRLKADELNTAGGASGMIFDVRVCDGRDSPEAAKQCTAQLVDEDHVKAFIAPCCGRSVIAVFEARRKTPAFFAVAQPPAMSDPTWLPLTPNEFLYFNDNAGRTAPQPRGELPKYRTFYENYR